MNSCIMKFVALALGICAGGCFSISVGDHDGSYTSERTGYYQCAAKTVTGVVPRLSIDGTRAKYHLELHATGEFVIHDVKKVITKTGLVRRWYFGILPGIHQEGPYRTRAEMNEEDGPSWAGYLCALTEVGFVFTTAYALFIEPFGEYHAHRGFATCALLGFSKRLLDEGEMKESVAFKETGSSHSSHVAKLYGYSLEIEGREYDGSSGSIYIGVYDFGYQKRLQSGSRLKARFIKAPSVRPESEELLQELAGLEFEIVCP